MTYLQRGIKSVTQTTTNKLMQKITLKTALLANVIRKFAGKKLQPWHHSTIIATQTFQGIKYKYYIAKESDFNIYLNPYFHEYDIAQFITNHLTPTDVFIDVGAHAGLYTLIAALKTTNGKVYSFEPNPENINYLTKNLIENDLHNVETIGKAASNKEGSMWLTYEKDSTATCSSKHKIKDSQQIIVPTITLDEAIPVDTKIKVMKIDTEGMDFETLQGGEKLLKRVKYVVVESQEQEIRELLEKTGFELSVFHPSGYLLATNRTPLVTRQ